MLDDIHSPKYSNATAPPPLLLLHSLSKVNTSRVLTACPRQTLASSRRCTSNIEEFSTTRYNSLSLQSLKHSSQPLWPPEVILSRFRFVNVNLKGIVMPLLPPKTSYF